MRLFQEDWLVDEVSHDGRHVASVVQADVSCGAIFVGEQRPARPRAMCFLTAIPCLQWRRNVLRPFPPVTTNVQPVDSGLERVGSFGWRYVNHGASNLAIRNSFALAYFSDFETPGISRWHSWPSLSDFSLSFTP